MRKILASLLFLLAVTPAYAGVPCALPFNLQNGTPADATQVMANYNAIITCLGNAAAAGNNSDITALNGLASPLPPASGGTQTFVMSSSPAGSGNAVVVSTTTPTGFVLTPGYTVVFAPPANNTGATTLAVGTTPAKPVLRRTNAGLKALVGGEMGAGMQTVVIYDGSNYQLQNPIISVPIGSLVSTFSAIADAGFVLLQGQCVSTGEPYAAVWTYYGSPGPGSCATSQWQLPDMRGRVMAALDSGGSNRITAAGGNFDGTVPFASGGQQNRTLTINELPAHSHSISDPGHAHNIANNAQNAGTGVSTGFTAGPNPGAVSAVALTGITTTNSTGSGNLFSTLPPIIMGNYELKL